MAYTGLGSGTAVDPYQITSVAQWREMFKSSGTADYFILMNDIDFASELYFSAESAVSRDGLFIAHLDGNSKRVYNVPPRGSAFNMLANTMVSIDDLTIEYAGVSITPNVPYYLFYSESGYTTFNIENLTVKVAVGTSAVESWGAFSADSVISNTYFDGAFKSQIIGAFYGRISDITIINRYDGLCRIATVWGTSAIIERFRYYKPYTSLTTGTSWGGFIAKVMGSAAIIREGFLALSKVQINATSTSAIGHLLYTDSNGQNAVVATENVYCLADISYSANTTYSDKLANSTANVTWNKVIFRGKLHDGTSPRTTMFGYGTFSDCFYDKTLQGSTTDQVGITGLTTTEVATPASFTNFDFVGMWGMSNDHPVLINVPELAIAAQFIAVNVADNYVSLTPYFSGYGGAYGFDVVGYSDNITQLTVDDYSVPVLISSYGYAALIVRAFVFDENNNRVICGGALVNNFSLVVQSIAITVASNIITLTSSFTGYAGAYGFEVIRISDSVLLHDEDIYSGPVYFDALGVSVRIKAFIYDGSVRYYCGTKTITVYAPADAPATAVSSPTVAYLQLLKGSLGGGSFKAYQIERKTDITDWNVVTNTHTSDVFFDLIDIKTYYRVAIITNEYGVGEVTATISITPNGGESTVQVLNYKIFLGTQEIAIK